jgi:dGTPase
MSDQPARWDRIEQEIIENNLSREEKTLSHYACKSREASRLPLEKMLDRDNMRPAFFHDTDRIIHSMAYSRYVDKTQVFFLFENDHITHRFLHVQLVSKIARTIGRFLRLNEDLIEAIALGHDIGHAPFGHDGERYLDQLCQDHGVGHFRHNAQSIRFLIELEAQGQGLNLTLQVQDGILCHNGEFISTNYRPSPPKNFDTFLAEYRGCMERDDYGKDLKPFTMEGCVVRVSDVIAYIGRDLEDAIAVKLINRRDIPAEVEAALGNNNRDIVDNLIRDLIYNSYDKDYLCFSGRTLKALRTLKAFSLERIYLNPEKQTQDHKIKHMFSLLFQQYHQAIIKKDQTSPISRDFLNKMSQSYQEQTPPARLVVDFISGMTDAYFQKQFREIFLPESFGMTIKKGYRPLPDQGETK